MTQHLYEISKDFIELQSAAEDAENVDENMLIALQDTMEGVQLSFEEKAQNIVNVMKNVTTSVSSIDEEIKRLQSKKTTIKNKEECFKNYLRENMEKTGINKIECPLFTITLSKPAQVVEIIDELELPDDVIEIETKIKPNKAEIKKLLQSGEDLSGAVLVDAKRRLTIK
jgi:hypothetical protein